MRKILYNMHFRSQTSPVVDHSEVVRTTGSATGCVVSTMIRPSGVQADIKPSDGDLAFFESELRVTGPNQFQEDGTITIGEDTTIINRALHPNCRSRTTKRATAAAPRIVASFVVRRDAADHSRSSPHCGQGAAR